MYKNREPRAWNQAGGLCLQREEGLPAQHTQNKVQHEKGAEDDKTDKVHPWKLKAHSIIHLEEEAPSRRQKSSG